MQRAKRLLLIGVDTHYGREVVRGIDAYCRLHGRWEYRVGPDNSSETVERAREAVRQWKADGIIAQVRTDRVERFMRRAGLPAVNFSTSRQVKVPTICSDCVAMGLLAAQHFLGNGFRNFAFAALTPETSAHELYEGFGRAVKTAGFTCEAFTDQYAGWAERDWVKNLQKMDRWLLSLKKPVALLCIHDAKAQQACSACAHLGLRVPEDVAIVGCGNVELYCQIATPRLSSVEQDSHRIGYEAARLLHHMMQGAAPPTTRILVAPRSLVVRQSSDMIAIDDPDVAAALRFIRDHADQPIGVKDLLLQVLISRKTMERRFEKLLGHSPKAEITRMQIEQAKRLLTETDLAMPDVAERSGFTNHSIFSSFFRKNTGLTPTRYRRNKGRLNPPPPSRLPSATRPSAT